MEGVTVPNLIKSSLIMTLVAVTGLIGGSAAIAGTPKAGSVVVVDTNGKIIGPFAPAGIALNQNQSVLLSVVGQTFVIPMDSNTGFGSTIFSLFYFSSDCSGQAYTSEDIGFLVQPGKIANDILYYIDFKTDQPVTFTGQGSLQTFNTGGGSSCAVQRGLFGKAYPAHTFDLSTLGFVAPFSVQLR